MKITEEKQLPDFGLFRRGGNPALRGRRRLPEEEPGLAKGMTVWFILNWI